VIDWITVGLLVVGGVFAYLSALGVARMPDLYSRMQAATKSATLGVGCIVAAVAVHFGELGVTNRSLLVIAFLLLTGPIAAHVMGRMAYMLGVPQWHGTIIDELRDAHGSHKPAGSSFSSDETGVHAPAIEPDAAKPN
jgi:multicomponent Na+:H+ antiporter subunit G